MNEFLTLKQVIAITKLSAATIRRRRARGEFPQPLELSSQLKRYRASDINAFVNNGKSHEQ